MTASVHQIPLDLSARPALGFDDYHIGPSNKDAVSWIDRWPEWPAPLLVISGPASCGKSHLAAVWQDKADAVFIKPEMLVSHTAEDIAGQSENLILDGIDLWIGSRDSETTLFHLYNIFKEEKRTFLVTSRMNPTQSDFVIADLASRFRAAPVATVKAPDDMLLGSVLIKLFSDRQLNLGNEVINYIIPRMERSFEAISNLVDKIDKMALSKKSKISIPLVRQVLMSMEEDE